MSGTAPHPAVEAERLRARYEARACAELADADALLGRAVAWSGSPVADVVVVKGYPGPTERDGGVALSGPDGSAVDAALQRLGWGSGDVFRTLSRTCGEDDAASVAARLRLQVEAVDPRLVIALDADAASDLERAFDAPRLRFGVEATVMGRRFLALDGLEASLSDERRKRVVWEQMKSAVPDGPIY